MSKNPISINACPSPDLLVDGEITNLIIKHDYKGKRLDKYLVSRFQELSRTFIQGLINRGDIKVCDRVVKSSYEIRKDDVISIILPDIPDDDNIVPEDIPLDIVYEDEHILAINKMPNMVVHPARGHATGTLVNAVKFYCNSLSQLNGHLRPGIVHRLDRDTTGVILIVKNDKVHGLIGKQFENREIKKEYFAIVEGRVKFDSDIIQLPIGRHFKVREKMTVRYDNGKPCVSRYEVVERFKKHTLVKVFPKTGRTHQIRVHMKYIGHPVVADMLYNNTETLFVSDITEKESDKEIPLINRHALHAFKITFVHPISKKIMQLEAPLHDDMQNLINVLRESSKE